MHEIHLTDKKLIHVFLWSLLLCNTTCNCTYLYTEDLINTILFMMHHKIPLYVPFIIFFEKSSRSHSGGLEICIQCCIVLYSYKKNKQYIFDRAWLTMISLLCSMSQGPGFPNHTKYFMFFMAKHRAVSKWKDFLLCFPKQSDRFRS